MLRRRSLIAAAATLPAALAAPARAQDWKAQYPELVFANVPSENAQGMTDRFAPFMAYLTQALGIPVSLRIANDYAAVIEGQRAGNVQIAYYGPASFARARVTGVATDAVLIQVNADGSKGYYSGFFVLASTPYKTIEALKGKNLGLVDPNSTSGNNMPRFMLDKHGINPEQFFGKTIYTGSHENAMIALAQGQVDVAANGFTTLEDGTLSRMLAKGMLRNRDGSLMKLADFRLILQSDLIINSPICLLSSLPANLKAAITSAFLAAPVQAPEAFARLSNGKDRAWERTDNAAYDDTVKLIRFVDSLRKV